MPSLPMRTIAFAIPVILFVKRLHSFKGFWTFYISTQTAMLILKVGIPDQSVYSATVSDGGI